MKVLVFLFPLVVFFVLLAIKLRSPDTYTLLIQEDSPLEYAQAFLYFTAAAISALTSTVLVRRARPKYAVLYAILAVALLVISLEEISWGQRLLGIETPEFFDRYNVQHEISIHNLTGASSVLHEAYLLIGAYGAFAWILMWRFVPNGAMAQSRGVDFIVPEWFISSYFLPCFAVYLLIDYVSRIGAAMGIESLRIGVFLDWRDQEPAELLLSMGFVAFVLVNHSRSRKGKQFAPHAEPICVNQEAFR